MGCKKWYEVTCDKCGSAEHFAVGLDWKSQAKDVGWLISKSGVFCGNECKKEHDAIIIQKQLKQSK